MGRTKDAGTSNNVHDSSSPTRQSKPSRPPTDRSGEAPWKSLLYSWWGAAASGPFHTQKQSGSPAPLVARIAATRRRNEKAVSRQVAAAGRRRVFRFSIPRAVGTQPWLHREKYAQARRAINGNPAGYRFFRRSFVKLCLPGKEIRRSSGH
jgi:hypothetical protein